jgi:hypothetical protein
MVSNALLRPACTSQAAAALLAAFGDVEQNY